MFILAIPIGLVFVFLLCLAVGKALIGLSNRHEARLFRDSPPLQWTLEPRVLPPCDCGGRCPDCQAGAAMAMWVLHGEGS